LPAHYNRDQFREALKKGGLRPGDTVLTHSNVGFFGVPEEGRTADAVFGTILGAFQDVLGPKGTIVAPTFTYSFCKGEPFDPENTPSQMGLFAEMLRIHPLARRSEDPIFSVAALGRRAEELTANPPRECFGPDSFWARFLRADGIVCFMNLDLWTCNFNHYVERCLKVPYRYDKLFTGYIVKKSVKKKTAAIHFCRDLSNPDTLQDVELLQSIALQKGILKAVPVGRGRLMFVRAAELYRLIEGEVTRNPWFMTPSGKTGAKPFWPPASDTSRFAVDLPEGASMERIIEALWSLPRDIISDGYDRSLELVATQVPMKIHEFPTGTHCWTWIVPEKWTCDEARLETLDGKVIFSARENPLHVMSYSLPFEGEVSREELLTHLHCHPRLTDAVPFRFAYYERNWGLCCSRNVRDSLDEELYRVIIRTRFSYGTLKVGEAVLPGESDQCFVLCAHLCHPGQLNDGLSGVAVGIEVMRHLMKRSRLRYTYRFLVLPETIGSVAYLSRNEHLIPTMKGGLFLEMLGLKHPHVLQGSFEGDSEADLCLALGLKESDLDSLQTGYRSNVQNDERQFNAPGVRVPMLSLSRALPSDHPDFPFPEYHSSLDSPEITSVESLLRSRDTILAMIEILEANRVPVNKFKGEVFCSRYGIHVDVSVDPAGNRALLDVMHLLDGKRSLVEICYATGLRFSLVRDLVAEFAANGLVEFV